MPAIAETSSATFASVGTAVTYVADGSTLLTAGSAAAAAELAHILNIAAVTQSRNT